MGHIAVLDRRRVVTGGVDEAMTCRVCGGPLRPDDSHVMGKGAQSDLWYIHAACLYGESPAAADRSPRHPRRLLPKI